MHTRRSTLRVATDSSDPLVTLPQVLLARTERLQAGFNAQLRRREVTKEYVALVLLDPSAQPLQPPPPLPPGGQACAASPPAPPTPPAALREGSMLVHWMEKRPRAPMRLSATSIEGACLRSGASPGPGLPPHLATPHQASSIAALPPARRHSARYARLCRLGAVRERGASRAVHAGTAARSLQRRRR